MKRGIATVALSLLVAGCGHSAPSPPVVTPPQGTETINGSERLGWDQPAADAAELATIRYAIYVDGTRSELTGATCSTTATSFACSARLPALTPGTHTLELASFVQDGSLLESPRSAPLRVTLAGVVTSENPARATASTAPTASTAAAWPAGAARVAGNLDRPTDLAVTPDGRAWIAERSGKIRVAKDGVLLEEPALVLGSGRFSSVLALAIDPQFARTRFVFAVYTARSRTGERSFTLARFREAGDTLADAVVLLDEIRASNEPRAALRFGPDGKLYAAFDNGGDEALANDPGSLSGKLLRLNPDGMTPPDQPRGSPILEEGLHSPRGIAWDRATGRRWLADHGRIGAIRWTLPPDAIAMRDDDLYVGSETGLLRARIDRRSADRLQGTSDVLRGLPINAIAVAPDGRIWFATDRLLGNLATPANP